MCISVTYMFVCKLCVCLVSKEVKGGHQTLDSEVLEGNKSPCGCWKLNPDPLKEELALS